jgi:hypothetical protein
MAAEVISSLRCPACDSALQTSTAGSSTSLRAPTSDVIILTRYNNEGGLQEHLNLFPHLVEEAYLEKNPSARPARAFLLMCAEGDITGIVDLLHEVGDQSESIRVENLIHIIFYQDILGNEESALHRAIQRSQEDVVWLLLWLASSLKLDAFPPTLSKLASDAQIARLVTNPGIDIRTLKDAHGMTAEDLALNMQGCWEGFLSIGILHQ